MRGDATRLIARSSRPRNLRGMSDDHAAGVVTIATTHHRDDAAHAHASRAQELAIQHGSAEWSEWVKDYYRDVETYDWVDVADRFLGLEAIFHRNRAWVVRRLIRRYGKAPFLDAGCGTGLNLRNLPPGSTGIDINPRNLALVAARLPKHDVVLADLEAMPFADASFETVLCTEVLEHVPDIAKAIAEIRRVLRPGGVLIGSTPAHSPIWRLRFLSSTCPHDEPFHNEYSAGQMRSMLSEFEIVRIGYSVFRSNVLFVVRRPA
jgi:ubiquinone/menaquinone biosynthesis C-methylase UbiE